MELNDARTVLELLLIVVAPARAFAHARQSVVMLSSRSPPLPPRRLGGRGSRCSLDCVFFRRIVRSSGSEVSG
jgi:hypothetical protein